MNGLASIFGAVAGAMVIGGVGVRLAAWLSSLRQRQKLDEAHIVIAEYDTPTQLSPTELGYIIDATFGSNELLATIAALYAKDLVKLTPLGDDDFQITAVGIKGSADDGESSVLGYVRNLPDATTTWSQLDSLVSDASGPRADFEDSVLQSLIGKGYLTRAALGNALFQGRWTSALAAAVLSLAVLVLAMLWQHQHVNLTTSAGYANLDASVSNLLFVSVAIPVWLVLFAYINLLVFMYDRHDGIPVGATDALRAFWPDVAGFQLFLRQTEYVRLQHDPDLRDPSMTYCLALGLDPGFVQSLGSGIEN